MHSEFKDQTQLVLALRVMSANKQIKNIIQFFNLFEKIFIIIKNFFKYTVKLINNLSEFLISQ